MDYFNNLPNKLVFIIFKKLNQSDLFSLRIVNKRFKEISEQSVNDLVVSNSIFSKYGSYNYWFLTYDLKSPSLYDIIDLEKFSSFRSVFNLESSLKRLHLRTCYDDFGFLEDFKQLEHLELLRSPCLIVASSEGQIVLNLPKLTTFLIQMSNNQQLKLKIESTKLQTLSIENFYYHSHEIEVANPDKLKYFQFLSDTGFSIEQFQNLEHLSLTYWKHPLDKELLSKLKELKVLEYDGHFNRECDLSAIEYILKQRQVLRRTDLVIRLNGVEIENTNQLDEIKRLDKDAFRFKYNHLLTGYLYHENILESNQIHLIFKDSIPKSIFGKFFNVDYLSFWCLMPEEENRYSLLLSDFLYVRSLRICGCKFNQSFYDKLVNCKYLKVLNIDLESEDLSDTENEYSKEPLNFAFVTEFRELLRFFTSELKDPYDVAVKAFKKSKYLDSFEVKDKREIYYNLKKPNDTYSIKVYKYREYDDLPETDEDLLNYEKWTERILFSKSGINEQEFLNLNDVIDAELKDV